MKCELCGMETDHPTGHSILCGASHTRRYMAECERLRTLLRRVLFEVQLPIALKEEIEKEVGDGDKS